MLAGAHGDAARWAIAYQVDVGRFFGAERLVPVRSAHVHCDGEALGRPGVAFLERWAAKGARVRVPLTLDPRSADSARASEIGQDQAIVGAEARIVAALRAMGRSRPTPASTTRQSTCPTSASTSPGATPAR